jgi:hypothetical protein
MYSTTMIIDFTILSGPGKVEKRTEDLEAIQTSAQQEKAWGGRERRINPNVAKAEDAADLRRRG